MKLYMMCKVKEIALTKWGSMESIQEEMKAREKNRLTRRAKTAEKKGN
jgi:hypothetical protein